MPLYNITGTVVYWIDVRADSEEDARRKVATLPKDRWATLEGHDVPEITSIENVDDLG
ncbi:MAG: hypothetical protein JWO15_3537 [Sphingomonadales bacterium]|nr:hypothetical protein [Sphingomonadales bacterium]